MPISDAGYIFSDQLELAVGYAVGMGSGFIFIAISLLAAWIGWKLGGADSRRRITSAST